MEGKKKLTAFHEAGHAVVALLVGRPVQKVSIIPSQNRLGSCHMSKGRSKKAQDTLESEMLILLAGMAAEGRVAGRYNVAGAQQDLMMVQKLASQRAGNQRQMEKLVHRTLDKVNHMLRDQATWSAVKSIANALLDSESISGREAKHLLTMAQNSSGGK